jgi:hypothetical protein
MVVTADDDGGATHDPYKRRGSTHCRVVLAGEYKPIARTSAIKALYDTILAHISFSISNFTLSVKSIVQNIILRGYIHDLLERA